MPSMKRNRALKFGAMALVCLFSISCGPIFWIQKYRDMPDITSSPQWDYKQRRTIGKKNANIDRYYGDTYGTERNPRFIANPIELDPSRFVERSEADGLIAPNSDRSGSGTKLTFFHLSDVHLRDEQVRLYDKRTSEMADYVISSFERSPLQEAFDGALYYAMVQTMNATVKAMPDNDPLKPRFMIHTGDAVDAGVVTELYEFLSISNCVMLPWYNVLGNHDSGVFGNIKQEMVFVNNPFVDFMALHSKFDFVNMHHNAYEDDNFRLVYISPLNTGSDYTLRAHDRFYSKFNGFDRMKYTPQAIKNQQVCWDCPGYYSIEVRGEDRGIGDPAIQIIVLDTGFRFSASGRLEDEQLQWLKQEIERFRDKIILVFGHHDLKSIENNAELKTILASSPAVVAYFCGHVHGHKINYHRGEGGRFGFWEVVADSLIEYPQQGSIVRIKYENGVGILEVYAFDPTIQESYTDRQGREQLSELYRHVQLSRKGALDDIAFWKKQQIDANRKDRYARVKFPYPKLR